MRSGERDFLLMALAVAAGSADGWSYFGLGHAFVANMTGNTVLIGLAVFQVNGDLIHPLISLIGYAIGTVLGSLLTRKIGVGKLWPRAVSRTLMVETTLMVPAEVGWALAYLTGKTFENEKEFLLCGVAVAIGMQSGAMLQLKIPGIVTTYITGTWTTLMNGLARFAGKEKAEAGSEKIQFEQRLFLQSGILAVYFHSAVFTGWLFRYLPAEVGALPAASVLLVALYGFVRA